MQKKQRTRTGDEAPVTEKAEQALEDPDQSGGAGYEDREEDYSIQRVGARHIQKLDGDLGHVLKRKTSQSNQKRVKRMNNKSEEFTSNSRCESPASLIRSMDSLRQGAEKMASWPTWQLNDSNKKTNDRCRCIQTRETNTLSFKKHLIRAKQSTFVKESTAIQTEGSVWSSNHRLNLPSGCRSS